MAQINKAQSFVDTNIIERFRNRRMNKK